MLELCQLDEVWNLVQPGEVDPTDDEEAEIGDAIRGVSKIIERMFGRHIERVERTELYDLRPGRQVVFLKGYPVDTGATLTVRYAPTGNFDGDGVVTFGADDYSLNAQTGRLAIIDQTGVYSHPWNYQGRGVVEVVYSGGMAPSQQALSEEFPDVVEAAKLQVAEDWRRRRDPSGTPARSAGRVSGASSRGAEHRMLLRVREVIRMYQETVYR